MQSREYGYTKQARQAGCEYLYQATVVDFDGEEFDFEVSAFSSKQAAEKIEALAASEGIQISYMNLYLVA